ncbi:hypothetical protein HW877_12400 [Serratia marcescens]|uniref:hypothetical protein n=1 Tax=Serratia marcescens TaxID=615 RepID=UPI001FD5C376|nr:hypothetical protein [Serratia marcescens]UOO24156.1 hypothetical protein HW877_12400 [Serratia marcescens]HBB9120636.1 hypothetical protein [Serratia marcescens]
MKKIILVFLTLMLSGCIGGGPSNAPSASPNEPYTCTKSSANSDCSQSVEPSMY